MGIEALSVLLGLLINLVEANADNRTHLAEMDMTVADGAAIGRSPAAQERIVPLLCRLISNSGR